MRFPELPAPFDLALRETVAWVVDRYDPLGIVAAGSIVRGTPDASSDLDLYVIHRAPWRQRVQRGSGGVPAEIFVNNRASVEGFLEEERAEGRPITAHMLATGFVVHDADPVVDELRARCRAFLAEGPAYSPEAKIHRRYVLACAVEDAADRRARDPATAAMILARAVPGMLEYAFVERHRWIPRAKDLLDELGKLDAALAADALRFFDARNPDVAARIADRTIGVRGFFEWEGAREEVG